MTRRLKQWAATAVGMTLIVVAMLAFYPRYYDVPAFDPLPHTQYWSLPTGSRIGYTKVEAIGPRQPFPIVYLHGGPGGCIHASNIAQLSPLAADGYDIYLYDQIGSGASARLENIAEYTVDRHFQDLEAIVEAIGADKVILIGQSWGAILATHYVAKNPGNVARLIVTGPGPILPIRPELADIVAPDSLQLREPPASNAQANAKMSTFRSRAIHWCAIAMERKLATDAEADNYCTACTQETNKSMVCDITRAPAAEGGNGYYAQIMTIRSLQQTPDLRPELRNCMVPIVVVKGQCDNQGWGYTREYLELFQNHRLVVVPNAGHAIGVEQPAAYTRIMREALLAPD